MLDLRLLVLTPEQLNTYAPSQLDDNAIVAMRSVGKDGGQLSHAPQIAVLFIGRYATIKEVDGELFVSDNASPELSTHTCEFLVNGGNAVHLDFVRGPNVATGDHFAIAGDSHYTTWLNGESSLEFWINAGPQTHSTGIQGWNQPALMGDDNNGCCGGGGRS